jgi:hypothetical protein
MKIGSGTYSNVVFFNGKYQNHINLSTVNKEQLQTFTRIWKNLLFSFRDSSSRIFTFSEFFIKFFFSSSIHFHEKRDLSIFNLIKSFYSKKLLKILCYVHTLNIKSVKLQFFVAKNFFTPIQFLIYNFSIKEISI